MSRSDEIDRLEQQVVRAVESSGLVDRSAPHDVSVVARQVHRGSLGIDLEVRTGPTDSVQRLFAKTMRAHSWDRYAEEQVGLAHPRLRRVPEPGRRLVCEESTLRHIAEMVAAADDPGFFAVTVAGSIPDDGVLVLDHIERPTLSAAIGGETDLDRDVVIDACRNSGRWLRRFHGITPPEHTRPGPGTNAELCAMLDEFADHLRSTSGSGWSPEMDVSLDIVRPALQPTTLGVGHGDFAAHNVFVGPDGSVGVFDTHAPLLVPVELDLAYFLTMLRFADLKGILPSPRSSADVELENAFFDGYGLAEGVARRSVAPYEVLVLLDRWCSVTATRGAMSPLRRTAKYLRRQVHIRRIRTALNRAVAEIERKK